MTVAVRKYGGTSLATPDKISRIADFIAAAHHKGHQQVIVVSAMGNTTDDLIALAEKVSAEPNERELDLLLTAGERISMALMSMALHERQVPAISLTGSQCGIITTASHRNARIKRITGQRVRTGLSEGKVVIVAGFQGVNENKDVTTLGRSGSDTTALAMAAFLQLKEVEIYTDVLGIYSADPRLVPQARFYPQISAITMLELASLGAQVLHPRSVELALKHNIMIKVGESQSGKIGTCIVLPQEQSVNTADSEEIEKIKFLGVSCDDEKTLIHVELARPSVLSALWDKAAEERLIIAAPMFSENQVWFYGNEDRLPVWKKILDKLSMDGFVSRYEFKSSHCPVSVVGECLSHESGALNKVMDALSKHHVTALLGTANTTSITIAVPRLHLEDAVRGLHQELIESEQQ